MSNQGSFIRTAALLVFCAVSLSSQASLFSVIRELLNPFDDMTVRPPNASFGDTLKQVAHLQRLSQRQPLAAEAWNAAREQLMKSQLGRQIVNDITGQGIYPEGIKVFQKNPNVASDTEGFVFKLEDKKNRFAIMVTAGLNPGRMAHVLAHEALHVHDIDSLQKLLKPDVFKKILSYHLGIPDSLRNKLSTDEGAKTVDQDTFKAVILTGTLIFIKEYRAYSLQLELEEQGISGNYDAAFLTGLRTRLAQFVTTHYVEVKTIPIMTVEIMLDFARSIPKGKSDFTNYVADIIRRLYPEALRAGACEVDLLGKTPAHDE